MTTPLKNTVVPAVMQAGLDTGKDPKIVSQGLLILENCAQPKQGVYAKRNGLVSLSGTHADENMSTYKDRPVVFGAAVSRHNGSTAITGNFDTIGGAGGFDVEMKPTAALSNRFVVACEVQEAGSTQALAYYEFDNVAATYQWKLDTYNRYSGVLIDSISSTYQIRIITIAGTIYYFKPSGSSSPIHYSRVDSNGTINTSMQTIGVASNTFTAAVGWYPFDLCLIAEDQMALVHQTTTGSAFEILTWDAVAFGAGTWRSAAITSPTTMGPIAVAQLTDGVGVAVWTDIGASPIEINAWGFDATITEAVSEATIWTDPETPVCLTAIATSATRLKVYITTGYATSIENQYITGYNAYIDTAGIGSAETAPGSAPSWKVGVVPVSKPVESSGGDHYMLVQRWGYDTADPTWTYWLLDGSGNMFARVLPGYAYWFDSAIIGAMYERATDSWVIAAIKRTGEETSAICLLEVAVDPGQLHAVETPEHLQIAGSCPWETDGQQVVEQGFHIYPYHVGATRAAPAGATDIGVGTYGYRVVYECYDKRGCLHRSKPSPTASVTTLTANDVVTLILPNLFLTRKTGVTIVIYRTAVDGSIYYRLKAVANSTSARTQTTTDSYGDAFLTDNEQLYVTGGVLDNEPPPPYRAHCVHQHRHVVANRDAESWDVRYSKEFVPNEGVAHNSFLALKADPAGGRITALASYRDRLLIFKAGRIYCTHGNGYPLVLDARSQGYAEPYLISAAVGCANQKTIVETPSGLMFEGADGIYLIDSTMQVQPVGRPAQYHYEQITLKAGALVAEQHVAIWVSSDGVALVWDYMHGQWLEYTGHEATDCVVAQGVYYLRTVDDEVQVENRSAWSSTPIAAEVDNPVPAANCNFARALAIDGNWMVVGEGVYLYHLEGGAWVLKGSVAPDADDLGWSVSIVAHSDTNVLIAAGAPAATSTRGEIRVYRWDGASLALEDTLIPAGASASAKWGHSVAVSTDDSGGEYIAAGGPYQTAGVYQDGAVAMWRKSGSWTADGSISGPVAESTYFGIELAYDVPYMAVTQYRNFPTTPYTGSTFHVYERTAASTWVLRHSDDCGSWPADIAILGDTVAVTGEVGYSTLYTTVRIFNRSGATWAEAAESPLLNPASVASDKFGESLAMCGDLLVVGAPITPDLATNIGSIYVYDKSSGAFTYVDRWTHGYPTRNDQMGLWTVGVNSKQIVGGASLYDDDYSNQGLVYSFQIKEDVCQRIRTGWFSFAGIGGYKRVREILLMGQNIGPHTLTIRTAYDFDPAWVDEQEFDSSDLANYQGPSSHYGTGLAAGYLDKSYLLSVATSRQKCSAVMLEIVGDGAGETFDLTGISFLVALKTGLHQLGGDRYV